MYERTLRFKNTAGRVAICLVIAALAQGCGTTRDGWRTAQWNVCTVTADNDRIECRSKIQPSDTTRTAAQKERHFIAKHFLEDDNLYSFTLQEICEEDVRWIAAYMANGGNPSGGMHHDFSASQYTKIDTDAPYAFLPYKTHEMMDNKDGGCGPGISTGIAAIAKRIDGTTGLRLQGLTNSDYSNRTGTGLTEAQLQTTAVCGLYFEFQAEVYGDTGSDGQTSYTGIFKKVGCTSSVPDTLRGAVCVRSRWQGPGDSTTYRVSTCATHPVHKGKKTWLVRNHQIAEAASMTMVFAGGTKQRMILSGDFNVVANRNPGVSLNRKEKGHNTILSSSPYEFMKVTQGFNLEDSSKTGTLRSPDNISTCSREIDAIYVKNWASFNSATPKKNLCVAMPKTEPAGSSHPVDWSDHEMLVSPLMSPHL
jgi:hypothetical protein